MATIGNGLALRWLGHATWHLTTPGGKRLIFDPWLGNPKCPEDCKDGVGDLDGILVTHGHLDHIADVERLASETGAAVAAMIEYADWLTAKGLEGCIGFNKGGTVEVAGLRVTMTHALHSSSLMQDGQMIYLGDPAGLIVELEDGFKIYNAGDTDVFGDMALIRELHAPDLAILPIGDHFTMGPKGAAKAAELLGVRYVVPQHYGTFPILHGDPEDLRQRLPAGIEMLAVAPGETVD